MTAQSAIPLKWYVPFATGDSSRVEIPVTSSDPTRASQTLGFPPLTMQPPAVGGVPPQGEDFNGAVNQVARVAWWVLNGGGWPYDATFATNSNIGGYPNGAVLQSADFLGQWISTADNNQNNPDTVGTSWVPGFQYGSTAVTGQTGGTTTLTPLQAAKRSITVSGTLGSAQTLVLPAWIKDWSITNNTTGAFALIVKTAAGSGVTIPQNGAPTPVSGDGTNITQLPQNIAPAATSAQPAQLGQLGHGQCRLSVNSATQIALKPFNGNNVVVNGVPLQLPAAGLTASNSGLTASTLYYVYLGGTTASPTLTLSTTGHSTASNGVETQTGNTALTLVGMVYSNASSQFSSTGGQILNWFNRRPIAVATVSFTPTTASTTPTNLFSTVSFLQWGDTSVIFTLSGYGSNNTAGDGASVQVQVDGVGGSSTAGNVTSSTANAVGGLISNVPVGSGAADAYHTLSAFGNAITGGTASFVVAFMGTVFG